MAADGSIDTEMSVGDILQTLGLHECGVGGLVGVRDAIVLLGTGIAFTAVEIRFVALNPPEATIAVTGILPAGYESTVVAITVNIDDLIPVVQAKDVIPETNPLKKDCSALMSRPPTFDYNNTVED